MKRILRFAALVVAATLSTVPIQATASVDARAAGSCAQVFILGIGGSGEPTASNPAGRTVAAALQSIDKATDVSSVSASVAWRPAKVSARTLSTSGRGWRAPYLKGARSAAHLAVGTLRTRAASCPDESIVLVGFSQGAVVARLVLRSVTPAVAGRVDAVELISDPVRSPRDGSSLVGTASSRRAGILAGSRAVARKVRIPGSHRASVTSVCTRDDVVCDAGGARRSRLNKHRAYADASRGDLVRAAQLLTADLGLVSTVTKSVDRMDELIRRINLVRAAGATCGTTAFPAVGPVTRVPLLDQVSQGYALRMAEEDFFGHVAPDGSDPITRARAAGYPHQVAEVIAAGQTTAASVVAAWRDSPEHCAVLMTGRDVGVGHAEHTGSTYVHYWALNARR